jgi:putative transposase
MLITRAYKIRLYPTKAQKVFFNKTFGCCRVIYNEMLYELQNAYKNGIKLKKCDLFKKIRDKYEWMKDADSQGLCNTYQDLNTSYSRFFNKVSKFPKFKKKKEKSSYRNGMMQKTIEKLIPNKSHIIIPKAGLVKFRADYDFSKLNVKKIRNLTIERRKTNKYYCSLTLDSEIEEYEHTGQVIGIDLGIKDLSICSDGTKFENPKYLQKSEKKISHLNRLYSKKTKGSKNQQKARLRLAIAHEKLCNKRKDNIHKLTTKLIRENDVICIEDLAVKNMMKNHRLAKAIQDASFGTIANMLKYKAAWHNRQIVEVGRFYPSSKLCSCCGHKMDSMPLSVREWICQSCGATHDRDLNAAVNIKNEGLRILDGTVRNTGTLGKYPSKLVENPTMDERLDVLKSSDSMNQELMYKHAF